MKFKISVLIFIIILSTISLIIDIIVGSNGLSFMEVLKGLCDWDNSTPSSIVIWDIRLPMSLMAPLVGGALALAGAQMQTTLNNPLADPYTFGISSSAALGAALVITHNFYIPFLSNDFQIPTIAFIFCMLTMLILCIVVSFTSISIEGVMLFGIALMFTFDALLVLIQFISSESELQAITFWKMGSLNRGSWSRIEILFITIIIITYLLMKDSWKLSMLKMGDFKAQSYGINTKRLKIKNLILIAILTSLSVSFTGAVGFVGLIAPHITRMLIGEEQRFFIPTSFFVGATLLELGSIASKTLVPGLILPLTVVLSFVGVPKFVFLIIKNKGKF